MEGAGGGEARLLAELLAAGLDPAGLDLARLAGIRAETERVIASYRATPGFADAAPAFTPARVAAEPVGQD